MNPRHLRAVLLLLVLATGAALALISLMVGKGLGAGVAGALTPTPASPFPRPGDPVPVFESRAIPTPSSARDLAPHITLKDKAMLIVRHAAGNRERIYLDYADAATVVGSLEKGAIVENLIPPESLVGHRPPQPGDPAPGVMDSDGGFSQTVTTGDATAIPLQTP